MTDSKSHYVYFICDARRRYVKIGVSSNPWWRVVDLQAGSALKIKIDHLFRFSDRTDAFTWEDAAHQHFAEYWRHGEWFDYGPRAKQFIAAVKAGEHNGVIPLPPCSCKQMEGEFGRCFSKAEAMALLKEGQRNESV